VTGLAFFRVHLAVTNDFHVICAAHTITFHMLLDITVIEVHNLEKKNLYLGVDVTANQDEISDHETFQLEYDVSTGRWYIRTMGDRYWTLETAGGIQASSAKK